MVNVDALGGKPVPKSWKDLLKPEYKGLIGYLDPASAFVGYVGAVAVNTAMGGSMDDFTPAMNYFKELKKNQPIVPKQTSYARVLSGEIPILFDYDFNAYRAKYKDKANIAFVIPAEGTVAVPYVMSMVAKAPHQAEAKKVLDFVLLRRRPGHLGRCLPAPGTRWCDEQGSRRQIPACRRLCPHQADQLRKDGRGTEGLLRPLPEGSAITPCTSPRRAHLATLAR